ncbi:MAG: serine acetyltransferase [Spirochaetaceae bacterium]|jgi:serine O-acetyltransferase|nr:serine acetyltransferase [Spirochaetaceae bacterium]
MENPVEDKLLDCKRKRIIELMVQSYKVSNEADLPAGCQINRSKIYETVKSLREVIFPGYFGKKNLSAAFIECHVGELLEIIEYNLKTQVARALLHIAERGGRSIAVSTGDIVLAFLSKLPEIRKILLTDVDATFDGDPAAFSRDEIISSYPGIYAIMVYRLAHELYALNVPLIPRIMTEYAHNTTGIDIHPGAQIGSDFFIDHGTGVVIGETTIIGRHVKIYQGVTLGGLSTKGGQALKNVKRHPTIEDGVTIYSGASIFGGATIIGKGAVIGSNTFITKSVPQYTRVSIKNPELQFKEKEDSLNEYKELTQDGFWDYVI